MESEVPGHASDSYRLGFRDGYTDCTNSHAIRDWSAGFQHGFDVAQQRHGPDDHWNDTAPQEVLRDTPGWHDGPPEHEAYETYPQPPPAKAPDDRGQPQFQLEQDSPFVPLELDTDDPEQIPPQSLPSDVIEPPAQRPSVLTEPDAPEPVEADSPEPPPATGPEDASDLDFDDLFVDPIDDNAQSLPAATLRGLVGRGSRRQTTRDMPPDEPPLRIRFRDEPGGSSARHSPRGVSRASYDAARADGPQGGPTHLDSNWRGLSTLFQQQHMGGGRAGYRSGWDQQFRIDPTQRVQFEDVQVD